VTSIRARTGQFVCLTAVVVETAFDLRSDAANEGLCHEVMDSIEGAVDSERRLDVPD